MQVTGKSARLMAPEHGSRFGVANAAFTVADQVLSSVGNALVLVCVAQVATPETFGAAALAFAVIATGLGFGRGMVGAPLLISSGEGADKVRAAAARSSVFCMVNAAICLLAVVVVALSVGEVVVALPVIALPAVLIQDMLRYCAIAVGRVGCAILSDGLWTLGMLAVFIVNLVNDSISVVAVLVVWVVLGWMSAVVLAVGLRVNVISTALPASGPRVSERVRLAVVYALDSVGTAAVISVAAITSGVAVAASVRAAATLFGPVAVLISSLPLTVIPRLADRNSRVTRRTATVLVAVTGVSVAAIVIGVLATLIPDAVGAKLLGETWIHAIGVVPLLGVEYAALVWFGLASSILQARRETTRLLLLRLGYGATQLVACICAGSIWGTGQAIGGALAVSAVAGTAAALLTVARSDSRGHSPSHRAGRLA
ncbi:hypothetical protein G3I13_24045 [Streptomyces sp. SID6673]|nr:hypothetical protein [Streptomyces sp. SID11726]NEB27421.1 hypothetical protein [Streptomyces sp. SID6673]